MKKNVRKALAISGLAIAIGASGLTLDASANTVKAKIHQSRQEKIVRTKKVETTKTVATKRVIPGVVQSTSDNSITMKSGSKTYTVSTDSSTKLLNRKWQGISFSDIQTGNKIRILGTISGTTIAAKTVRDITLPASTSTK